MASDLDKSPQANQVNAIIYCMGDKADDVLKGLRLTDEQRLVYSTVKEGSLTCLCLKRTEFISEPNSTCELKGRQNADLFITALYALAEDCKYEALGKELLRDRIVVGIRDGARSQKIQMERRLDLAKAINRVRQAEDMKRYQT